MYSTVLGGRLARIVQPYMRLYHDAMNIPPPPLCASLQNDLLLTSEYMAINTMMKSKIGLQSIMGINRLTSCVHAVVSYDGA